jgi:hypothetical protein
MVSGGDEYLSFDCISQLLENPKYMLFFVYCH